MPDKMPTQSMQSWGESFMAQVKQAARTDALARGAWTIGDLLNALENVDGDASVALSSGQGLQSPCSYRGHYERLALQPGGATTATDVRVALRGSIGETFTGYKGGEFEMDRNSLLHVAHYGSCGVTVVGLKRINDEQYEVETISEDD